MFRFILLSDELNVEDKRVITGIINCLSVKDKSTKFDFLSDVYCHEDILLSFGKIIYKFKEKKQLENTSVKKLIYDTLDKNFLPHIGDDNSELTRIKKLIYYGLLIKKLILTNEGIIPATDRDSYSTKRLHSAGVTLSKAFKQNFSFTIRNDIKKQIKNTFLQTLDKSSINLNNLLNSKNIGSERLVDNIEKSIKTGTKEIKILKTNKLVPNRISSQMLPRKK